MERSWHFYWTFLRAVLYEIIILQFVSEKVDSKEKWDGSGRRLSLSFSLGLWRLRIIWNLNLFFPCKTAYSVSACNSLIKNADVTQKWQRNREMTMTVRNGDVRQECRRNTGNCAEIRKWRRNKEMATTDRNGDTRQECRRNMENGDVSYTETAT